jgi:hypothetical protein
LPRRAWTTGLLISRQIHQLFMRGAAAAAHQGDIAGVAQQLRQLFDLLPAA